MLKDPPSLLYRESRPYRLWCLLGAVGLAVVVGVAALGVSFADEMVTLRYDKVGRLHLVGTGWQPNDHVVILVNSHAVTATADSAGEFEVPAPAPEPGEVGFRLSWRLKQELSPLGSGSGASITLIRPGNDPADDHRESASLLQVVLLPVAFAAAGLLLVVASGIFAVRRLYRVPHRYRQK
jgi:hypothetical protein